PPLRALSYVLVPHGRDDAGVRLGIGPRIHNRACGTRRGSGKIRVEARMSHLPYRPEPIDLGVVHPEDGVGRSGRNPGHRASDPDMNAVVDTFEAAGEC